MYKTVVFDIDGTIIDSRETALAALQQSYYLDSGKKLPQSELVFAFGIPCRKAAGRLNVKNVEAFVSNVSREYNLRVHNTRPFSGMECVIRKLHEKKICLGIVTSNSITEYEEHFKHFFLNKYFYRAMCAEHTTRQKPYPDPLLKFLELSGTKKEEALFIGDTENDQLCAQAAGVDFALAGWGAVEKLPAKYILDDPPQILKIV